MLTAITYEAVPSAVAVPLCRPDPADKGHLLPDFYSASTGLPGRLQ